VNSHSRPLPQKLLDFPGSLLIDVGSNEGDFIQLAIDSTTDLNVLGFEPHPQTFERLSQRFAGNDRVHLQSCCLGNDQGTVSLFDHSDQTGSEQASLLREAIECSSSGALVKFDVPMNRLDDLPQVNEYKVSFIKIDVEGYEQKVLEGALATLKNHKVPIVLLEFNSMNVSSRTFFIDLRNTLSSYRPYRILPGGRLLELRNYGAWKEEIFTYQNIAFFIK